MTGAGSRLELEADLFGNVNEVSYTYSLPKNAFEDLEQTMTKINDADHLGKDKLFLISLGPTGTILAQRLAMLGEQALDIGHISSSYGHVVKGGPFL